MTSKQVKDWIKFKEVELVDFGVHLMDDMIDLSLDLME